ncbi:MAG: hypothetical protein A6F71_09665 [Cycloclasticus sp. symbiont of Poecilosclerida sp. M]|nr:MAG: hypothetical protein A6F71_09665 [Cycloclasticus sp. symbiont of Poecilosclerida sp. M]
MQDQHLQSDNQLAKLPAYKYYSDHYYRQPEFMARQIIWAILGDMHDCGHLYSAISTISPLPSIYLAETTL